MSDETVVRFLLGGTILFFLARLEVLSVFFGRFDLAFAQSARSGPIMPELVSLLLLAAALWVILLGHYDDATQKWAFGTAGSICGYWLSAASRRR